MMGSAAKMSGVATRHPIPAEYQIHDARFLLLIVPGAELQTPARRAASGRKDRCTCLTRTSLLWSDVRRNRCLRLDVATGAVVVHQPANFNNGHTLDREGRVIACEHGTRSVVRFEHDGARTVLADRFDGKRLNSPNDVVVASDGSIWFTDPTYGIDSYDEGHPAESEIGASLRVPHRSRVRFGDCRGDRHGAAERPGVVARRTLAVRRRHGRQPRP